MQALKGNKYKDKKSICKWAADTSLPISPQNFIRCISDILHDDYKKLKCPCFDETFAWDADEFEIELKKGKDRSRSETVDFVVGLENGQLLMVEAKLSVSNVDNIKGEVEKKIEHTRHYLVSSYAFTSCYKPSIVLFGPKDIERNIRRYRNMRNSQTDIVPMSVEKFYNTFFDQYLTEGY